MACRRASGKQHGKIGKCVGSATRLSEFKLGLVPYSI